MDIYSLIKLVGGLAFFLYGMKVMSDGLEKSSDGKIEKYLDKITQNKFFALLFGAVMTIAVQSSSAVTVMLVGLVNSGMLEFGQTIGVLMGSNIGTTLTAWILSLAGIDSDIVWVNLLKPANFAPIFALVGVIMIMAGKKQKHQSLGNVLVGFAVLMSGMTFMSDAMEPLSEMPEFASLLTAFENPILAVLVGAGFTGVIQSSAASVAILQALSMTGGVTYGMALPIIMGQNIGTCVTALLSSIGVNRSAKKVAVVHLSFNIIGTTICLIPFCIASYLFDLAALKMPITPFMVAVMHSIFNIFTTLILLPFTKQLEMLANKIIPEVEGEKEPDFVLDERLFAMPSLAIKDSTEVVVGMCNLSRKAFKKAALMLNDYTEESAEKIHKMERKLDQYEDMLGTHMMKLTKIGISDGDSKSVTRILHTIDDFERIGDHAINVMEVAKELHEKKQSFSGEANKEIELLNQAIFELLDLTSEAFETNNLRLAVLVEPLEQTIDKLVYEMKRNHIARLQAEECTIKLGFAFSDLLTSYERVADHCSNIAVAIIEAEKGTYEPHEYLKTVKYENSEAFERKYREFRTRFSLKNLNK
ncbi:MAG: Na/Pi cotransporter family protein [Agathobacter sp.]|nr:Na/Pi cotransporter family protein [Agathobacter sp.]